MQAIKYAAMVSRFTVEVLADAYADFVRKTRGIALSKQDALDQLAAHTELAMNEEKLRAPRITLIAGGFPPSVTATAVWLSEMGLDITLTRVQAYRTPTGVIVTVSQHYPPPDVEDFLVAPTRASRRSRPDELPEVEWTDDDLQQLHATIAETTIQVLHVSVETLTGDQRHPSP
jgi:hypothetical protein